jgi:hypothetical protein
VNRATRIIVATMGVLLGLASMNHGLFEILQGNKPTNGLIIQAIGDGQQMWSHGTEEAFTILPNFLLTGVMAMLISIAIIIWSVGFVHKKRGSTIFILLFLLLFLVGGGIGQIVFFIPTWLASTRINKPLTWWRRVLLKKIRPVLAKLWPYSMSAVYFCFLFALEIAIFGLVPGVDNPDTALTICWSFLFAAWILMLISFVSGFAFDIQHQTVKLVKYG